MKNLVLVILCSMFAGECYGRVQFESTDRIVFNSGGGRWLSSIVSLRSLDPNEIIYGVEASFVGPSIRQVNPLGMATPFQNLNGFFGSEDVRGDSQFLFHTDDLSPPALAVEDTETRLTAAITNLPGATNSDGTYIRLAQIVHSTSGILNYRISIDVRDPTGKRVRNDILDGTCCHVPEPGTTSLLTMAAFGLVGVRRRRVA